MSERSNGIVFVLFDRVQIIIEFLWRDIWIGAYIEEPVHESADEENPAVTEYNFYICLIPMLPIHIRWFS